MSYEIRFTTNAEQDFRNIGFNILEQSKSLEIALRFQNRLLKCLEQLKIFPESGINPKDRYLINYGYRFIIESDYLLFYKIFEEQKIIRVTGIFNGKQNYIKQLKNRI